MNITKNKKLIISIIGIILSLLVAITTFVFQNSLKENNLLFLVYIFYVLSAVILLFSLFVLQSFFKHETSHKLLNTRQLTAIGIQSALTIILYLFVKIQIPLFPTFLDVHVSEIPALISSFVYGPYVGSLIIVVRFIVKLPNTITVGVGEVADLIIGLTMVIVSGLIYKKNKTLKGAITAIVIATLSSTLVACLVNGFILIPAYMNLAKIPLDSIIKMCSMIPGINEDNFMLSYILFGALPFNLFRFLIVDLLTFFLYKKVGKILHRFTD